MKVDRDPTRPVRHLEWRARLLGVGAVLALAGIYFDSTWIVNVALAVLLASFVLRFTPDRSRSSDGEAPEPGPSEPEESDSRG